MKAVLARCDGIQSIRMIGVVKRPQVQMVRGSPVWSCTLSVPQIGTLASDPQGHSSVVRSQDHYRVKCTGRQWYEYCREHLLADSVVLLVAKPVQRPRYLAIHATYTYETELHVGAETGLIQIL